MVMHTGVHQHVSLHSQRSPLSSVCTPVLRIYTRRIGCDEIETMNLVYSDAKIEVHRKQKYRLLLGVEFVIKARPSVPRDLFSAATPAHVSRYFPSWPRPSPRRFCSGALEHGAKLPTSSLDPLLSLLEMPQPRATEPAVTSPG